MSVFVEVIDDAVAQFTLLNLTNERAAVKAAFRVDLHAKRAEREKPASFATLEMTAIGGVYNSMVPIFDASSCRASTVATNRLGQSASSFIFDDPNQ